jgi:methylglutaconyl-CoA hydratase
MVETAEDVVLVDVDARGVATLTLNRPQVFNGYNAALLTRLGEALSAIEADSEVRVVLLRGAGKHFSAGADVNWFKELANAGDAERLAAARLSTGAMRKLQTIAKPSRRSACARRGATR